MILGIFLDRYAVPMLQYSLLNIIVDLVVVTRFAQNVRTLLAEYIEERLTLGNGGVERSLHRHDILRVVFLIVREDHQLRDIQERAKRLIAKTHVDALALRQHTVMIVRFFDLDKGKRKTIDEAGDIRAEIVLGVRVFAREFRRAVPEVVVGVVEVDNALAACGGDLVRFVL